MLFIDLVEQYGKNFTVAYVTLYDDDLFHMYLRVYPSKNKDIYRCAFRIDTQDTNEHIIMSERNMFLTLSDIANKEVEDYH